MPCYCARHLLNQMTLTEIEQVWKHFRNRTRRLQKKRDSLQTQLDRLKGCPTGRTRNDT